MTSADLINELSADINERARRERTLLDRIAAQDAEIARRVKSLQDVMREKAELRVETAAAIDRAGEWERQTESLLKERNAALMKVEYLRDELNDVRAERLRLTEKVTMLSATNTDVAVRELLRDPREAVGVIASVFFEILEKAGGKNFAEWRLKNKAGREILLFAQPADGMSPQEVRAQMLRTMARAVKMLQVAEESANETDDADYAIKILINAGRAAASPLVQYLEAQKATDMLAAAFAEEDKA